MKVARLFLIPLSLLSAPPAPPEPLATWVAIAAAAASIMLDTGPALQLASSGDGRSPDQFNPPAAQKWVWGTLISKPPERWSR